MLNLSQSRTGYLRAEVLRLALPAMLEMIAHMSISMVDTAMVGRLGPDSLSAVGMAAQVFWTVVWVFGGLSAGAVAIVSRSYGAGDNQETSRRATEAVSTAALASMLLFLLLRASMAPALNLVAMGVPVRALMREYLGVLSLGSIPVLITVACNGVLRSTGNTRTPLMVALIANSFNAVADWALIFGKLGFPAMGVRGAAIASVASMVLGCSLSIHALANGKGGVGLIWGYLFRWRRESVARLIALSIPAAAESLLMDGARSVQMFIMSAIGNIGFAAHQVAVSCESLSFMPGYGFAIAASVMVGQSLGAGDRSRARDGALECLRQGALMMGLAGVLFLSLPGLLVRVFTDDPAVIGQASVALRTAGVVQPLIAVTDVLCGALRGAGDTRTPLMITALGAWVVRIPLTFLTVRVLGWPLVAVWIVNGLEWGVRAMVVWWAFRTEHWAKTGRPVRGLQAKV